MLFILLLVLVHQFSDRVCCLIWVTQSEDEVDAVVGGTIALRCQIHSDSGDEISRCRVRWYIRETGRWREVGDLAHLKGRIAKDYDTSTTNTTVTITELTINDTDTYFCTLICNINGQNKQHHGNGTNINICDYGCLATKIPITNVTVLKEPAAEIDLQLVPLYTILALKLVVVIVITTHSFTCHNSEQPD
ncbi:hypothetical protein GJAV_G00005180 [Gymnothorax javanicus]|nr:hypothetical protein GJAV_G00005180 [Gymnothorax javanicus]